MLISDPIKAFNLTPEQAKTFAVKLSKAAIKREASYVSNERSGYYKISIDEACDNDPIVSLALRGSWNECMDFIKSQGLELPQ